MGAHGRGVEAREQQWARRREVLAELRESFGRFRVQHPRGSRVPEALRRAVLAALGAGVAAADIRRVCGVTEAQVEHWGVWQGRASIGPGAPARRAVREFKVVAGPGAEPNGASVPGEPELELRLGPWAVSVRLIGTAGTGRG
jgi:hypothetical protein